MSTTPPASNKDLVRRHYEDFINRGDLSAADRDLRPDFIDHAAPPGTPPGPESAKIWITMVRTGFPDIQVREEQSIGGGDEAVTWSEFLLVGAGPMMVPCLASNRLVWRLRCGGSFFGG
jgi:SnoaL-like polyketide cyclase